MDFRACVGQIFSWAPQGVSCHPQNLQNWAQLGAPVIDCFVLLVQNFFRFVHILLWKVDLLSFSNNLLSGGTNLVINLQQFKVDSIAVSLFSNPNPNILLLKNILKRSLVTKKYNYSIK